MGFRVRLVGTRLGIWLAVARLLGLGAGLD